MKRLLFYFVVFVSMFPLLPATLFAQRDTVFITLPAEVKIRKYNARDQLRYQELSFNVAGVLLMLPIVARIPDNQFSTGFVYRYHEAKTKMSLRLSLANAFGGSAGVDRCITIDDRWEFTFGIEAFLLAGRVDNRRGSAIGGQIPLGLRYRLKDKVTIGTEAAFGTGLFYTGLQAFGTAQNRVTTYFGLRPASGLFVTYIIPSKKKN